jgi:hypothetical protein
MTPLLRKMRAQARIEGTDHSPWENAEDDYAVVDDTTITGPLRITNRCHTPGKHLTPYQ